MFKPRLSPILPVAAILLIIAFQGYWVTRLYKDESAALKKETSAIFRDLVYNLQIERFKKDTLLFKRTMGNNLFVYDAVNAIRRTRSPKPMVEEITTQDSSHKKITRVYYSGHGSTHPLPGPPRIEIDGDKIPPEFQQVPDSATLKKLAEAGIHVVVNLKKTNHDAAQEFSARGFPQMKNGNSQTVTFKATQKIPDTGSFKIELRNESPLPDKALIRMITDGKALDDSLSITKLDSAYKKELAKASIPLSFVIRKGLNDSLHKKDSTTGKAFATNTAIVGFIKPAWYLAEFENPGWYLLKKISLPLVFSLFLIGFTTVTIVFLYRNMLAQRKLTEMKNDFISNITHELKTPIATVNVAIEALRNFGGLNNPAKTKEYLDISAAELQRLSLLVDKVLKLSLFEKQAIALQKESFDLLVLVNEVMASMKLQFDSRKAFTQVETRGSDFMIDADKLHITSVLYNLLDNALKYSNDKPSIVVYLAKSPGFVTIKISDNGIGIPAAYRTRIFDQFFRVPGGNRHNSKGYGLGLSYVNHIVQLHRGTIAVETEVDNGTVFTIQIPLNKSSMAQFDKDGNKQKDIFEEA